MVTSGQIKVNSSKPFGYLSYVKPPTRANGQALTNLAKTTIYHYLGKGLAKYKDIPAIHPTGGGTIQEKITLTLNEGARNQATICVTARDMNGQEG